MILENFTDNLYISLDEAPTIRNGGFVIKKIFTYKQIFLLLFYHIFTYTLITTSIYFLLVIFLSKIETLIEIISPMYWGLYGIGLFLLIVWLVRIYTIYSFGIITSSGIIIENNKYDDISHIPISPFSYMDKIVMLGKKWIQELFNVDQKNEKIIDTITIWIISFIFTVLAGCMSIIVLPIFLIVSYIFRRISSFPYFILLCMALQERSNNLLQLNESAITLFSYENTNIVSLKKYFGNLGKTITKITNLLIKIEKTEKKINKGNLFDSEKYINSLRGDIVTPLIELKKFLEKQREKLLESQKELSRVRVGGSEELGNKELFSKRSETLLGELEENIEKLEKMIGKMR